MPIALCEIGHLKPQSVGFARRRVSDADQNRKGVDNVVAQSAAVAHSWKVMLPTDMVWLQVRILRSLPGSISRRRVNSSELAGFLCSRLVSETVQYRGGANS
jgi:hypothetical protein